MSFGRNPHVAKAQAAEQKAQAARDDSARSLAWREAARQWDRAAEREQQDKRRLEYEQLASDARSRADGELPSSEYASEEPESSLSAPSPDSPESPPEASVSPSASSRVSKTLLN